MDSAALFSFDVFIHKINQIHSSVALPALGFRLAAYPICFVHFLEPSFEDALRAKCCDREQFSEEIFRLSEAGQNFVFERGKSCLFQSTMTNLCQSLGQFPLSLLLVDIFSTKKPLLISSCALNICEMGENVLQTFFGKQKQKYATFSQQLLPIVHTFQGKVDLYDSKGHISSNVNLTIKLTCLKFLEQDLCSSLKTLEIQSRHSPFQPSSTSSESSPKHKVNDSDAENIPDETLLQHSTKISPIDSFEQSFHSISESAERKAHHFSPIRNYHQSPSSFHTFSSASEEMQLLQEESISIQKLDPIPRQKRICKFKPLLGRQNRPPWDDRFHIHTNRTFDSVTCFSQPLLSSKQRESPTGKHLKRVKSKPKSTREDSVHPRPKILIKLTKASRLRNKFVLQSNVSDKNIAHS